VRLSDFFDTGRGFMSVEEIAKILDASPKGDGPAPSSPLVESLLIFDTAKQRTWLLLRKDGLHCVIDKPDQDTPRSLWRIRPSKFAELPIRTEPNSRTTGKLYIGEKKPRLYSLRLFTDVSVERRVRRLLQAAKN
jgi:hypothetical protein